MVSNIGPQVLSYSSVKSTLCRNLEAWSSLQATGKVRKISFNWVGEKVPLSAISLTTQYSIGMYTC